VDILRGTEKPHLEVARNRRRKALRRGARLSIYFENTIGEHIGLGAMGSIVVTTEDAMQSGHRLVCSTAQSVAQVWTISNPAPNNQLSLNTQAFVPQAV
jgi:hypothetical protein